MDSYCDFQQDAHETLGHLLNKYSSSCAKAHTLELLTALSMSKEQHTECLPVLSVDLSTSVQQSITNFLAPNRVYYENKEQLQLRSVLIAPSCLIVHLRRFAFVNQHLTLKLTTATAINPTLQLPLPNSQRSVVIKYQLASLVAHSNKANATAANSGHYKCYVPRDKGWLELDDGSYQEHTALPREVYSEIIYCFITKCRKQSTTCIPAHPECKRFVVKRVSKGSKLSQNGLLVSFLYQKKSV